MGNPAGSFSFRDNSYFPMHFGLVQWQSNIKTVWIPASAGKTGERRDGFPLPRERRVSGGMDSRSPIGVGVGVGVGVGDKLRGYDG